MIKSKRWFSFVVLALALIYIVSSMADEGLFPTGDQLFGVTMPDIRFAVGRDPDGVEITEDGEADSYSSFTISDYEAFGKYAKAEGMGLKNQELLDGTLCVDLMKDDSTITFRYCYKDGEASLFYPKNVRKEQEKYESELSDSILPDSSMTFGAIIPSLETVLPDCPVDRVEKNGYINICYNEVMTSDYDQIKNYLSAIGCKVIECRAEGRILKANMFLRNEAFAIQYDLPNAQFVVLCPELYYVDDDVQKKADSDSEPSSLPALDEAFDTILPRISSAILRDPVKTEVLPDGSLYDEYSGFSEEDYSLTSKYLMDSGCSLGEYHVDDDGVLVIQLIMKDRSFTLAYDQMKKRCIVTYPVGAAVASSEFSRNEIASENLTTTHKETYSKSYDQPILASADEFTLHNGVKFGMTRDEVKKIEEAKGFLTSDWPTVYLYYDDDGKYTGWKTYALLLNGSMAGMPDSQLFYYFTDDDKLSSAVYRFGEHDIKAFDEIKSLLDDKYSAMKADTHYTIASNIDYFYNEEVENAQLSRFNTFQIAIEDGSTILVRHILMYPGLSGYDEETSLMFGGRHYLEYRLSTIDEIEAVNGAIERKQQLQEEVERLKEEEHERQRNEDI